jgi:polysaccharide deacetylase family protein (PEP-CTERM system associated)
MKTPRMRDFASRDTEHLFTVDVEEHFHVNAFDGLVSRGDWERLPSRVERNVAVLLDLLARHDALGTFFTLGWVARRNPGLVRRIADAGHEIACHSFWHRRAGTLAPGEFREDVRIAKAAIEDAAGQPVFGFRAPSFSIVPGTEWAFDVLLEEGYRYDSSIFPIRRPDYGYPGAPADAYRIRRPAGTLLEIPLATTTVAGLRLPAAGGGYLRHLPLALIQRALREHADRRAPAMFYIHPWEIDPDQPRLAAPLLTRIRHYRGLARTLPRLERLLAEFRFTSVARHFGIPRGPAAREAWARVAV